jgi:DNA invertase Pin-like site-specific DNA recombinase
MKPAIAYTRVSTSEQGRSGLGLDAQREAIHDFARREGFEISEIFQDIETGKGNDPLAKRQGLDQALRLAKKLKCPIIVSKLDRLSRDVEFIAGLISRGILFHVVPFGITSDTFTLHIHAAVAQQERKLISERTKSALARKKAQGHQLGNVTNLPEARRQALAVRLQKADSFAQSLQELVVERRQRGGSLADIAQQLNLMGIKTARGGDWKPMQVSLVLERACL